MPCCFTAQISRCWSAVFDPWFKWAGLGVMIGFWTQWKTIYDSYFDETTGVEQVTGLLLFGFGLNFVVIGTTFSKTCGTFLRTRAFFAHVMQHHPLFSVIIQVPMKILLGMWLSIQMVKTWARVAKAADCLDTDDCEGYLLMPLMHVRDKVCPDAWPETDTNKHSSGLSDYMHEFRESQLCLDVFYFLPFGFIFFATTLISAITVKTHLMKQQRLRDWRAAKAAARATEIRAEEEAERLDQNQEAVESKPPVPPVRTKRINKVATSPLKSGTETRAPLLKTPVEINMAATVVESRTPVTLVKTETSATPVETKMVTVAAPVKPEIVSTTIESTTSVAPVESKTAVAPVETKTSATPVETKMVATPVEPEIVSPSIESKTPAAPFETKASATPVETKMDATHVKTPSKSKMSTTPVKASPEAGDNDAATTDSE